MKAKTGSSGQHDLRNEPLIKTWLFHDDGIIPNNPRLPVILYQQALRLKEPDPAMRIEHLLGENQWGSSWRNGIFDYHHYHSTAHEVLAAYRGAAKVKLGGEMGVVLEFQAGDILVLPAGTGHKRLSASSNFKIVGAYPAGQDWDLCRGTPEERQRTDNNIARVALPLADPIYGGKGPLMEHWNSVADPLRLD